MKTARIKNGKVGKAVKKGVHAHEKAMHKGKPLTKIKTSKNSDY